jgi:hypothetical protein|tara:strand:- start:13 stop:411 length:399 start_codon:yes stop_codon:yes gene_type:complete
MAAGRYSFVIEQGATTNFEIQYKDTNNNPIDLSDYTGRLQIRSTYAQDSGELYLTLSSSRNPDGTGLNFSGSNGSTPPTSGSIGIYIAACTSSALTFNEAKYDLEIYSGSGHCPYTVRLLEGNVKLSKEVTT